MEITFTNHAVARMAQRGISTATVRAVIKNGEHSFKDGVLKYTMEGMGVVVKPKIDEMLVLTVYDADWKPKERNKRKDKIKKYGGRVARILKRRKIDG